MQFALYVNQGWETRCLLHCSTNKPLAYWLGLQQRPWLSCAPEDFHYSTGISGCGERLSVVRVLSPGPIMFLEVKLSGL